MLLNDEPSVGEIPISSDRSNKPRPAEGVLLYLVSLALAAAATIVLFGVASIPLLGTSKETLTASRVDNSTVEDKLTGTVFFYTDNSDGPTPVQTRSQSLSEASNLVSSTPAPKLSSTHREETEAKASPNVPPEGGVSATVVAIPNGSTQGPSTDGDNFIIQPSDRGNLDHGNAAFTREESQVKDRTGSYGPTVRPGSLPLRHAASHRASAVEGEHNITKKLNRAELSRLLQDSRASLRKANGPVSCLSLVQRSRRSLAAAPVCAPQRAPQRVLTGGPTGRTR